MNTINLAPFNRGFVDIENWNGKSADKNYDPSLV